LPMASIVPVAALPPTVPLTDQVTAEDAAPFSEAVNCSTWPAATKAVPGVTEIAATAGGLIVTTAEPDFDASALLVASTVALVTLVTVGAVNLPVESTVPVVELPPAVPLTDQVTPAEVESPVTVAVNWAVPPEATVAVIGETVTEMAVVVCVVVLLLPPQPMNRVRNASEVKTERQVDRIFRMIVLTYTSFLK
jgi:hypothetical protein